MGKESQLQPAGNDVSNWSSFSLLLTPRFWPQLWSGSYFVEETFSAFPSGVLRIGHSLLSVATAEISGFDPFGQITVAIFRRAAWFNDPIPIQVSGALNRKSVVRLLFGPRSAEDPIVFGFVRHWATVTDPWLPLEELWKSVQKRTQLKRLLSLRGWTEDILNMMQNLSWKWA